MSSIGNLKAYQSDVKDVVRMIDDWEKQLSEPDRLGTFDEWEKADYLGKYLMGHLDTMANWAAEVDPQSVQLWKRFKQDIADIRIIAYQQAKFIDGPNRPVPTQPELDAAAVEEAEARRTGGASLVRDQLKDENGRF
jgi:hypothetical protein